MAAGAHRDWYANVWDGTSPWQTASHPLWDAAGNPGVLVGFAYNADASFSDEGLANDNVSVLP